MESEIQKALGSILTVDGITGAMAIGTDKSILGALMPNLYTEETLVEVSDLTMNTYSTLKELKIRPDEMVFDYDGMQLFVKDLRGKGLLMVMNESDVSASFLNIATNMARKKIVSHLNNKKKKIKVVNSTTQPVSNSSRSSFFSYQTDMGDTMSSAREMQLSDEMTVFNKLIKSLHDANCREFPGSESDLYNQIKSIIIKSGLNPVLNAEFSEWCESKGNRLIVTHISTSDMQKLIHPLYVYLCEYHGPIEGEKLMNMAISEASQIPEAKRYSPRQLL